jgi:hypothetical protein
MIIADILISSNIVYGLMGVTVLLYCIRDRGIPERIKVWGIEVEFRKDRSDKPPPGLDK